jgi:ubiquitin C-terminal hydrolase
MQLFQNFLSSTVQCPTCNYHTYNFDPSIFITLPIPKLTELDIDMNLINQKMLQFQNHDIENQKKIRNRLIEHQYQNIIFELDDCFENLTSLEQLDDTNKWDCPVCQTKVNAYKILKIWIPPKIMIIQIKRFIHNFGPNGYTANKINNMIQYPIWNFNINKYMSKYASKLGTFSYDLCAVSNHAGNINGGHYYSYVKSSTDNNWYIMDDDTVRLIQEDQVVSPNAYILFYKLKE